MLHSRTQVCGGLFPPSWHWVRWTNSAASRPVNHDRNENLVSEGHRTNPPMLNRRGRSAFIRMTKFMESPADAFAIIRAVERKYGALTEYRFFRDFEVGTKYQTIIHIAFRDPQSVRRISSGSDILQIPAPRVAYDRPGGIGLEDLAGLLDRQEYLKAKEVGIPAFENVMESVLRSERDERDEKNNRILECRIQRSNSEFFTIHRVASSGHFRRFREVTARNFIDWGGFYDIKPIEKGTLITNEDLFETSHIDHIRMRRTIRKWSEVCGLPNPYEYSLGSEQVIEQGLPRTDNHVEWEPLPGYESTTEDVSIHSNVGVTPKPQYPRQTAPSPMSAFANNSLTAHPSPPAGPNYRTSAESTSPPQWSGHVSSHVDTPGYNHLSVAGSQSQSSMSSSSVQDKKSSQLRAARNLVKRAQQQQQQKQAVSKPLNSRPTLAPDSRFIRPPVTPLEGQNATPTEKLKGLFKSWF